MGLKISKDFGFSASHVLDGLPPTHKCTRLHGHSYRVRVTLSGQADEMGFVLDLCELAWVREVIDAELDHRHLNDILDVNPTAENLAAWLARRIVTWLATRPERHRIDGLEVGVSETQSSWVVYSTSLSLSQ